MNAPIVPNAETELLYWTGLEFVALEHVPGCVRIYVKAATCLTKVSECWEIGMFPEAPSVPCLDPISIFSMYYAMACDCHMCTTYSDDSPYSVNKIRAESE